MRLYDFTLSGHAHKVRLLLDMLDIPHERVQVDLVGGEQHTPQFRAMNLFGTVPVLDDGGTVIRDSNAILIYLATKVGAGDWLPSDPLGRARVQEWLAIAGRELADGPARARFTRVFGGDYDLAACQAIGRQLFTVMDQHLKGRDWLALDRVTIADLSSYSYTAHAPEGGIDLAPYGNLRAWLRRIEGLDKFTPMPASAPAGATP